MKSIHEPIDATDKQLKRLEALKDEAIQLSGLPAAARVAFRLQSALDKREESLTQHPFCVTLIGGTGVGKSALFNALTENVVHSPSSQKRPTTSTPYVSVHPSDEKWIPQLLNQQSIQICHASTPGIIVIDTPDLDSMVTENRETAQLVLNAADLVIFVTCPDKRANYDILMGVRKRSIQKRWLFVMNKADNIADYADNEAIAAVCKDFLTRLSEIGFSRESISLFTVSATTAERFEFHKLQEIIFSAREQETVIKRRREGFLALIRNSVSETLEAEIKRTHEQLFQERERLQQKARDVYTEALTDPAIQRSLTGLVREQMWQSLPEYIGGPMALPIWLRCHISRFKLAYQLSNLALRGPSVTGVAGTASSVLQSIFRGQMPLQRIVAQISSEHRKRLQGLRIETRRILEDHHLDDLMYDQESEQTPAKSDAMEKEDTSHMSFLTRVFAKQASNHLTPLLRQRTEEDFELEAALGTATKQAAEGSAASTVRYIHKLLTNLLPSVVLLQFAYRLTLAWNKCTWSPGTFYLSALGMFCLALLPGYFLIAHRANKYGHCPTPADIISHLDQVDQLKPMSDAIDRLSHFLRRIETTRQTCDTELTELATELDTEHFGSRASHQTEIDQ